MTNKSPKPTVSWDREPVTVTKDETAKTLRESLSHKDGNNVVDGLFAIAEAIKDLATAVSNHTDWLSKNQHIQP